jgi:hypothetical protein
MARGFPLSTPTILLENPYGKRHIPPMNTTTAFQRGIGPILEKLLPGREETVLAAHPDPLLRERVDDLASRHTEGLLTPEELEEYTGYVRANKFVAVLRREAKKFKSGSAA